MHQRNCVKASGIIPKLEKRGEGSASLSLGVPLSTIKESMVCGRCLPEKSSPPNCLHTQKLRLPVNGEMRGEGSKYPTSVKREQEGEEGRGLKHQTIKREPF